MKITHRDRRLIQVLVANKNTWLTSKEIFLELGKRWEIHGFKGSRSVEQVLRKFNLLRRRRFATRENEYFCVFSLESPKVI